MTSVMGSRGGPPPDGSGAERGKDGPQGRCVPGMAKDMAMWHPCGPNCEKWLCTTAVGRNKLRKTGSRESAAPTRLRL